MIIYIKGISAAIVVYPKYQGIKTNKRVNINSPVAWLIKKNWLSLQPIKDNSKTKNFLLAYRTALS